MIKLVGAVLCGVVLAVPAAIVAGDADPMNIPASECAEAVEAREAAGLDPVDTFAFECPDPSTIEPYPQTAVLERDAACRELYEADPAWCPTAEEVEDAVRRQDGRSS